jgi:DNA modification methylase
MNTGLKRMSMKFKNKSLEDSLTQASVNLNNKTRSNLFSWRGQFSPQLIELLLTCYSSENDVVFDPFLGSGTVLMEAAMLGLEAYGCEINPAAVSFASVYELINHPKEEVAQAIAYVEHLVSDYTNDPSLLDHGDLSAFQVVLIEALEKSDSKVRSTILTALITGMDFKAKKLNIKRINNVWGTLRSNIQKLPLSNKKLKCYNRDSRCVPLKGGTIDFVVTSPPYINVFNYHQNYRKAVELIGADILKVAKSEIGANRKFRQNRFLTVVQYCMDISQVFIELRRVCKPDAKLIFIVGRESNVRKTAFKNAELISEVATICGFELVGQQHRVFQNKFGDKIYEEILRFSIKKIHISDYINAAREVGRKALRKAIPLADKQVREDLLTAYEKSLRISPSPILY